MTLGRLTLMGWEPLDLSPGELHMLARAYARERAWLTAQASGRNRSIRRRSELMGQRAALEAAARKLGLDALARTLGVEAGQ